MPESVWPTSAELHAAAAERMRRLLDSTGGLVAELGQATLSTKSGLLSEHPHSLTTALAAGACVTAGGHWRDALWPCVGAECMMAAADLFDDAADTDPGGAATLASPGVLLTVGAGLLSLATAAVANLVEDGADHATALALEALLGEEFARATNGQATNLLPSQSQVDALTAYRQSEAKSGPLGSLIARLGGRTASFEPRRLRLLGEFGHKLAVRSQLLNDARDAAPEGRAKADVRAGARTVPLAFTGSSGPPTDLSQADLAEWETRERARIAARGGLVAAQALAEAERVGAIHALDALEQLGCPVDGLRALL
jgi:geranylgeranyl pyrophosphate synthase